MTAENDNNALNESRTSGLSEVKTSVRLPTGVVTRFMFAVAILTTISIVTSRRSLHVDLATSSYHARNQVPLPELETVTDTEVTEDGPNINFVRDRHCEITHNRNISQCHAVLSPLLQSKTAWHFLGDFQMGLLFNDLIERYPYDITSVRNATGRCGFMNYTQMEPAKVWSPPNSNLTQGPIAYGLEHNYCTDGAGKDPSRKLKTAGGNLMEFLFVEFASDVEQQTPETNTTQETVALYLKRNQKEASRDDSVCVVNTGLHDQALCSDTNTTCMYLENVKTYLTLLDTVCGHIVWLGLSAVREDADRPQRSFSLLKWNKGVKKILQSSSFLETSFFVDIWEHSLTSIHVDNVHFTESYYDPIAELFAGLV